MPKRLKLFLTALLSVAFLYLLGVFMAHNNTITISIFPIQDTMDISAYLPGSTTNHTIRAYYDGHTNYYLFLPSYAEGQHLSFTTSNTIILDSAQASASQILSDNCSFRFNDIYQLHILIGSDIPTAFLNLEQDLSYLTTDKANTTSGQATFLTADGSVHYSGELKKFHGRGNATWDELAKKPFNIDFNDSVELYGMTPSKEYCLIANFDTTFLRNYLTDEIGSKLNLATMQRELINLYINGEYQGIYELSEKISANTLDIPDLESASTERIKKSSFLTPINTGKRLDDWNDTISGKWWTWEEDYLAEIYGGYILESDLAFRYDDEPSGFTLGTGAYIVCKEPAYLSETQYTYISTYMQHCENMLYQSLTSGEREPLEQCMDIPSFIAKYLLEELSKNLDASITSQYFYINREHKLVAGPIWDYDRAYGCDFVRDGVDYNSPEGFAARENIVGSLAWWQVIYYHSCMHSDMIQMYNDILYPYITELTSTIIQEWENKLTASAVMDYLRWDRVSSEQAARKSYHKQVQSVSDFLDARKEFLYHTWNP